MFSKAVWILAGAGGLLIALVCPSITHAAAYDLTTSIPQSQQVAYMDTTWTTQNGSADTLMFGTRGVSYACVWTDASETITVKWVGPPSGGRTLYQTGGTTPPAASRSKARYGSKSFSSKAQSMAASTTYCCPSRLVYGVIVTGVGGTPVISIQFGNDK